MADQALVSSNDHHHLQKAVVRKSSIMIERKPLMLKDYLLDDLSSCSSNGFKSLPRRQCCSTVRFLLEIDLKHNHQHRRPHIRKDKPNFVKAKRLFRSSRSGRFNISVLQRASDAVINAVKQLPFPSVVTSVQNRARKGLLPRSLSRKLLNNRFWGRATDKDNASNKKVEDHHHEEIIRDNINRWRLYPQLPDNDHQNTTTKTIVSSSSSGDSKSNSWCESEFTTTTTSSSRQSETTPTITSAHENDVVGLAGSENDVSQKVKKKVDHITVGEEDTTELGPATATCSHQHAKEWPNEEDKEQFSPVSVLDCPFEDDDQDETNSPFNRKLARLEGTKQKLLQKIRRFENLTQLEPIDLEKRIIAMSDIRDDYDRDQIKTSSNDEIEDKKAWELVTKVTKNIRIAASSSATNKLLFDFFRERMAEERGSRKGFAEAEAVAVKSAEDWTVGAPTREVLLRWEVNEGRKAYTKEMEKGGRWRNLDEENGEIDLELEALVWDSLMEEILLDLLHYDSAACYLA